LIRVAIVANTFERAQEFATLLAEDDRLDIVDARAYSGRLTAVAADVIVAIGATAFQVADLDANVVLVSETADHSGRNVRAVLPISASAAEISAAIQAAAHDMTVLTPDQVLRFMPRHARPFEAGTEMEMEQLTVRELQVLRMIADGNGNRDIALALSISEHTVKFHVAQILAKTNATSRTEAVAVGIRRGLIAI
jgi:DNA-binding NarL/FixJ family response regulator